MSLFVFEVCVCRSLFLKCVCVALCFLKGECILFLFMKGECILHLLCVCWQRVLLWFFTVALVFVCMCICGGGGGLLLCKLWQSMIVAVVQIFFDQLNQSIQQLH